jgi:ATP-dependent Clp protease ATP-binding subunit ClpA
MKIRLAKPLARMAKTRLASLPVNLIAKAAAGRIDPLIGRSRELDRTIQVLCRPHEKQSALCW